MAGGVLVPLAEQLQQQIMFNSFTYRTVLHIRVARQSIIYENWDSFKTALSHQMPKKTRILRWLSPEEGAIDAMGVAMMLLGLSAASCCICTAATVATGDRYADWATKACCWTSWRKKTGRNVFYCRCLAWWQVHSATCTFILCKTGTSIQVLGTIKL